MVEKRRVLRIIYLYLTLLVVVCDDRTSGCDGINDAAHVDIVDHGLCERGG